MHTFALTMMTFISGHTRLDSGNGIRAKRKCPFSNQIMLKE